MVMYILHLPLMKIESMAYRIPEKEKSNDILTV